MPLTGNEFTRRGLPRVRKTKAGVVLNLGERKHLFIFNRDWRQVQLCIYFLYLLLHNFANIFFKLIFI